MTTHHLTMSLRSTWLLAAFAMLLGACSSTEFDNRNDLREYALDPTVPRSQRLKALRDILAADNADTHLRATAAQMLGLMRDEEAIPLLMKVLGEGTPRSPVPSEYLRMEAVLALGGFGRADLYRRMFAQLIDPEQDTSGLVRRMYVQSFQHAEIGDADTGSVLVSFLRVAKNKGEDDNLVFRALLELQRITNRPDLKEWDFDAWDKQIAELRKTPPPGS